MKLLAFSVVLVLLAILTFAGEITSPMVQIPKLSTELDQFGARPGTFHFVTNEQAMADAAQLKQTFEALDKLDSSVALLDKDSRERLKPELATLRQFASAVHARSSSSAGPTAAEAEQRLNDAKGKYMCGACHGHGGMHHMMHGQGRGPGSNQN